MISTPSCVLRQRYRSDRYCLVWAELGWVSCSRFLLFKIFKTMLYLSKTVS